MVAEALFGLAGLGLGIGQEVANYGIAQDNLALEREMFEYNQRMQQEIFAREDTAVQRRKADLEAAGIPGVLAAGSAAQTSQPIKSPAPQLKYTAQYQQMIQSIGLMNAITQMRKTNADISQTKAQTAYIDAQALGQRTKNIYDASTLNTRIAQIAKTLDINKRQYNIIDLEWKEKSYNAEAKRKLNYLKEKAISQIRQSESYVKTNTVQEEVIAKRLAMDMYEIELQQAQFDLTQSKRYADPQNVTDIIKSIVGTGVNVFKLFK